jgi:PleD family two-component response regulator
MTQPLALVVYERLLPGTQVVNRLQDLNYRVQTLGQASRLTESAEQLKPMIAVVDLVSAQENVCAALVQLKQNPATRHLPVIAFGTDKAAGLQAAALAAGATLIVSETALLSHLPQLLDQALQVD